MTARRASDLGGLLVAALTLLIVLAICFMCVHLFKARRPGAACREAERFAAPWHWSVTTGTMPVNEYKYYHAAGYPAATCCGTFGVPPPTWL